MTTNAVDLLIALVTRYGHEDNAGYCARLREAEKWLKRNHKDEL
jgi:hypothetical protein